MGQGVGIGRVAGNGAVSTTFALQLSTLKDHIVPYGLRQKGKKRNKGNHYEQIPTISNLTNNS